MITLINKNASFTKRGPGRVHQQGPVERDPRPLLRSAGAGSDFVQRINAQRNAERRTLRQIGRRQYVKLGKLTPDQRALAELVTANT